jgi:hypothetical protein
MTRHDITTHDNTRSHTTQHDSTRHDTAALTAFVSMQVALPEAVVQVSCGRDFTLFLTTSGRVYSCGADDQGQCVSVGCLLGYLVVVFVACQFDVSLSLPLCLCVSVSVSLCLCGVCVGVWQGQGFEGLR